MRILFLTRSLHLGGAEIQLLSLATGLRKRGHEVLTVTFYEGGVLWNEARSNGLPCASLQKSGRWDLARVIRRLARIVTDFGPEVIYSFLQGANITLGLARPFLGHRKFVWGVRASNIALSFYGPSANLALRAECVLARSADALVCNSHAGRDFYAQRGVRPALLHVIPNGIDVDHFRRDMAAGGMLRKELGTPAQRIVLAVVGRVDPVKDHSTALRAAALLRQGGAEFEVWIVGDAHTSLRTVLERQISSTGMEGLVRWLGPRRDMRAVYSAMDVLISASLSEGFPNVIAEAAACGVPSVVTDVGDSAVIVDDRRFVAPPGNAGAIASATQLLLALRPDGAEWRNKIVGRFDLDSCIVKTESLLCRLTQGAER